MDKYTLLNTLSYTVLNTLSHAYAVYRIQLCATGVPGPCVKEHSANILLTLLFVRYIGRTEIGHNFWKPVTKRPLYMQWILHG